MGITHAPNFGGEAVLLIRSCTQATSRTLHAVRATRTAQHNENTNFQFSLNYLKGAVNAVFLTSAQHAPSWRDLTPTGLDCALGHRV